ncbi:long-chain fatty alcohol dehydrogenase [Aspergillus saccharolyticus JOP 1030-1]|uniref:Long-chain-alcohol oxidase n=1 Tax=Aspergillus saccharolyticus JOP 1030-1 TaxID=1450539 RepID=A0A319A0H7_9EURO|nr:long-chain fatty alcohol dehydrogenase [Aspergillus saccharolyticus JOP 1030-1]PYH41112.1 long-chain fatty alcohol dehydrogenase [Aspergillus saccharolyticus JOP 1030-1]
MAEIRAETTGYTPREVAIPLLPTAQVLTDLHWETLLALADAVIPSIRVAAGKDHASSTTHYAVAEAELASAITTVSATIPVSQPSTDVARAYLDESPSSLPQFREGLQRLLADYVHKEGQDGIRFILDVLNTRAGALLLTGSTTPVQNQPVAVREQIFAGWASSRLPPIRLIYRSLSAMFKTTWMIASPTLPAAVGFPRVPMQVKYAPGCWEYEFLQFPPPASSSNDDSEPPETIETDIVIIGSGCGGAVAAKNLAEAGHRVLVVEKSYHYASHYFPMDNRTAPVSLFEGGASILTDDASVAIFAGSTWGGGGTVNWSAALQTQAFVRHEWAHEHGLPFFTSAAFQTSLDRVCDRMGVSAAHIRHNRQNRDLLAGARKLGYAADVVPQNTGGEEEHYCGYCTLGCSSAGKKGPTETWLADAAKAGAVFVEGFKADRITFTGSGREKMATGVEGTWTSREAYLSRSPTPRKVVIQAKKVIVSCGTLNSPLLLLRSGLQNWHLGRNLHIHPVLFGAAVFDEEIRPWEGSALTAVVKEFENLDGRGHGAKIETTVTLPPLFLPIFPWRGGLEYKKFCAKLGAMTSYIAVTRDRESGRVYPDPVDGRIRVQYTPSPFDRKSAAEALIASAKMAYLAGAKEFHVSYADMPPFSRSEDEGKTDEETEEEEGINNPALQDWIKQFRQKFPLDVEKAGYASAHQMGTCRMASAAGQGVVDPECQVWGTQGLYVMDASIFPSASGVNPMITNMAIADWASRNLSKKMRKEER